MLPLHDSNNTSLWSSKSFVMTNYSCACCFIGKRCPEKTGSIYSFRFKMPLVCPLNETLPLKKHRPRFSRSSSTNFPKEVTGSDTVCHWPPNPCMIPIGYPASYNDSGLKLPTTSRTMASHPLKSYGQIDISIASWECSTILLGKLVRDCVTVVEPVEFMSHDLKLILYCVSGQTHPPELK